MRVGVVDTGIQGDHPDIAPNFDAALSRNFTSDDPVIDGSCVDLVAELSKNVEVADINAAIKEAAEGPLKGVLQYMEDEIVSCDIVGNAHSSIFDSKLTMVMEGNMVKVISWYDNEWGYSNRCVDLFKLMAG